MVVGFTQRVDLDLGGIFLHKHLVEPLNGILGVLDALLTEPKVGGDVPRHIIGDPLLDIDVGRDDGLWGLFGHGFDVHATLRGGDDDGRLGLSIHENSEIEFPPREFPFADVDGIAKSAGGASLLGDKLVANHLIGKHFCFRRSLK